MLYSFVPLKAKYHDREQFNCGVDDLDEYLKKYARINMAQHVTVVYVMTQRKEPKKILGYYTLSAFCIGLSSLPDNVTKKLPYYPEVPTVLIGRLARHNDAPGTGRLLLIDALRRSWNMSKEIASFAVVVDAKNDDALRFYKKFGFLTLQNTSCRLFMPMKKIEHLLNSKN